MKKTREEIKQRAVEREMLALGFRKMGMTFPEIGKELGVSHNRAREIYLRCVRRIHQRFQWEQRMLAKLEQTQ